MADNINIKSKDGKEINISMSGDKKDTINIEIDKAEKKHSLLKSNVKTPNSANCATGDWHGRATRTPAPTAAQHAGKRFRGTASSS